MPPLRQEGIQSGMQPTSRAFSSIEENLSVSLLHVSGISLKGRPLNLNPS